MSMRFPRAGETKSTNDWALFPAKDHDMSFKCDRLPFFNVPRVRYFQYFHALRSTIEVSTIAIDLLRIGHAYTTDIGVPGNMGSGRYMQRTSCQIVKRCSVPMLYMY